MFRIKRHVQDMEQEQVSSPEKLWTRTRIITILGLAAAQFFSYTSVFILSSFFPPLGEEKKISGVELGLIIGIIQGIFAFVAFTLVQITHIISPKWQVVGGQIVTGVCTITFGFLDNLHDGKPFFSACFLVRVLQGIGIAACDVSVFFIANQDIPPKLIGTVIGILEFSLAAAIAVSPPVGGYLFEAGGFYLPFAVSGVTSLLSAIFCFFSLPITGSLEKQNLKSMLKHLVKFDMLVFLTSFTLGGGYAGFFAGIIEPHLRKFNLSPGQRGLVILITNAISGVTFPIWGLVTDKINVTTFVAILGGIMTATGFIFFGPFPGMHMEITLFSVCGSLLLCGCGISAVLISSYKAAYEYLITTCDSEDKANSVLSSSYPSAYSIGGFLGAILGGTFVDSIGFRTGSAILFGLQLFGISLHLILLARRRMSTALKITLK